MHTYIAQMTFERIIFEIAIAAMDLQRFIDDIKARVGRKAFCHSRLHGRIRRFRIHLHGSLIEKQARSFELSCHIRQLELKRLKVSQRATKLLALQHIGFGSLKCRLSGTE